MLLKILGGLHLLGLTGMLVGWAWMRRRAFAEGIWWGLLCLLVPGGSLVFLFRRWDDARDPCIALALGLGCALPLVLSNPGRYAQSVRTGMAQDGWRGAVLNGAFPLEPAAVARRPDPWPIQIEEEETEENRADAEPTPTGPSDAFEREADIAAHVEQREREARQAVYDRHRTEAEALFQELNARRTRLKAADAKAVAAFNADAARYAALLEQARAERAALDRPPIVVIPPDLASRTPPLPGRTRRGGSRTPDRSDTVAPPGSPSKPLTGAVGVGRGDRSQGSLRANLEAARAARDAASAAEDGGAWAADVYGNGTPAAGTGNRDRAASARR